MRHHFVLNTFVFKHVFPFLLKVNLMLVCLLSSNFAFSEGRSDLEVAQRLRVDTVLFVDIVDANVETFTWTGDAFTTTPPVGFKPVSIRVFDPDGVDLGKFATGSTITPTVNGSYRIIIDPDQEIGIKNDPTNSTVIDDFEIVVNSPVESGGRLYSFDFQFNATSFAEATSTSSSFFAVVDGGDDDSTGVIELKLDGLAGFIYNITVNDHGVDGDPARSLPDPTFNLSVSPQYKIYLNPPTDSTYSTLNPSITDFEFSGLDEDGNEVPEAAKDTCNALIPGKTTGIFKFNSNVRGRFRVVCDINNDGVFDITSDDDVAINDEGTVGGNSLVWDGRDNKGDLIPEGTFKCIASVFVGEFHYVGQDMETSYEGLRLFEVPDVDSLDTEKLPLNIFWNDEAIQANAVDMPCAPTCPNGNKGLETSGTDGISSGTYTDAAIPNVNARSWGNFTASSKGNLAQIDTFTFLAATETTSLEIIAESESKDTDDDGVPDFEELCVFGTSIGKCDTDNDCICDLTEITVYGTDPQNPDTDGDGLQDGTEVGVTGPEGSDTDMSICIVDEDPSTTTEPLKPDTDGDGCIDGFDEDVNFNGLHQDGETNPNVKDCPPVAEPNNLGIEGGGIAAAFACALNTQAKIESNHKKSTGIFLSLFTLMTLLSIRLTRRRLRPFFIFLLATLITSTSSYALNVQSLRPSTGVVKGYQLFSSETLPQYSFAFGLNFNYDVEPLEITTGGDPTVRIEGISDQLLTMDVLISYGMFDWLTLNVGLPINLYSNIAPSLVPNRLTDIVDPGDMTLNTKIQIFDAESKSKVGFALVPFITIPTGNQSIHIGDSGVSGGMWVVLDTQYKDNRFYLNVGTKFRSREQILNLVVDDEFLYGLGYQRPIWKKKKINLIVEAYGSTTYNQFFSDQISSPIETHVLIQKKWGKHRCQEPPPQPKEIHLREQVHFKTDHWDILPQSFPILDEAVAIMKSHPEILKVQIEGNTDYRATEEYNLRLSDRRAKSVYDYFVEQGISPERLTWIGFGELRPIATNKTPEGMALNRRTVLRILDMKTELNPLYIASQERSCKVNNQLIMNVGGGVGWSRGYGTADARGILGFSYSFGATPPPLPKAVPPPPPKFISLREQVHFITNKATILPQSYPILDEVVVLLNQHPEILKVQIEGHTDSRSSDSFNMRLSDRRARAVYDYLVQHGISPHRLTWIGFGESRPIAPNSTEEGMAQNRRTVLRVLQVNYSQLPGSGANI